VDTDGNPLPARLECVKDVPLLHTPVILMAQIIPVHALFSLTIDLKQSKVRCDDALLVGWKYTYA
jgi:hypothetical protein